MTRAPRLLLALVVSLGGVVALAGPAAAATPSLAITSGPYAPDQTVGMLGSGCPAGAPVSIDIWDTAKPGSHVNLDHATDASGSGTFGYAFDLDNRFDRGAQVGFFFSCTPTVDWSAGASLVADPKYGWISLPDPQVAIDLPSGTAYGSVHEVVVRTDSVLGGATLTVDDDTVTARADSVYGWWIYDLPASLGVGAHHVHATWDPAEPSAPTVSTDATLQVTRARPSVVLVPVRRAVARAKALRVRIGLTVAGTAPRTGTVVLKDGRKVLARVALRVGDGGSRVVKVRLGTRIGKHRLVAVYRGSAVLTGARSAPAVVRVRR
ncbi:hypothetical protein GCM10022237_27180 [Nocardioides ginsengisoli]|uniref:Ig-like domain repeat protein n=1 Tax=Nocardioides ginsengisoli TaxID=363868 RepID=A0ABW3W5D9_9ACTN